MTALLLSALLLQTPPQLGQWEDVMVVPPDTIIQVQLDAGSITGIFVSATPDTLVLHAGRRDATIDRTRVKLVSRTAGKPRRGRNALIGLGSGAVAGLVWQKASCKGNMCMAEAAVAYTLPLQLVGTLAGALAPSQSWTTIYKR